MERIFWNCFFKNSAVIAAIAVGVIFAPAVLVYAQTAGFPAGVTQDQIDAALKDVSAVVGEPVTTPGAAAQVCNQERFLDACARIGKTHGLYDREEEKHVDALLGELRGETVEKLKSCEDAECLLDVAEKLRQRLVQKDDIDTAETFELTRRKLEEKRSIVSAAKEAGVDPDLCRRIDPATAPSGQVRDCLKLAQDKRIQKILSPDAKRATVAMEKTPELQEALRSGTIACGDGTLQGCGTYCLSPTAEARAQGVSTISPVCREIAAKFFGPEGVRQLETAYSQVNQVYTQAIQRAEAVLFITPDGRTLTDPAVIGRYLEEEGQRGNVEVVERGMKFLEQRGFGINQKDKQSALEMVRKIREQGGKFDFDDCSENPESCAEFVPDDERGKIEAGGQIDRVMREEMSRLGVADPNQCEFNPQIGEACVKGARAALERLENAGVVKRFPEAEEILAGIRLHIDFAEAGLNARQRAEEQIRQGKKLSLGGQSFGNFEEMRDFCGKTENAQGCLVNAAQEGLISKEVAAQKYGRVIEIRFGPETGVSRTGTGRPSPAGPYPGFIEPGLGGTPPGQIPGFTAPGRGFGTLSVSDKEALRKQFETWLENPQGPPPVFGGPSYPGTAYPTYPAQPVKPGEPYRPGYPTYPYPQICPQYSKVCEEGSYNEYRTDPATGCSIPECRPIPGYKPWRQVCPSVSYISCPEGQFREEFRDQSGCYAFGECRPFEISPPRPVNCPVYGAPLPPCREGQPPRGPDGCDVCTPTRPTVDGRQPGPLPGVSRENCPSQKGYVWDERYGCYYPPTSCPAVVQITCPTGSYPDYSNVKPWECPRVGSCVPGNQPCPALPTVESCPAGQKKIISYSSSECGTFYKCETSTSCPSGQYWDGGVCVTSGDGSGQREQVWNPLGLRSQVYTRADPARIETLKQACANVPPNSYVWLPRAGDSTSVDFGMPDPAQCRLAAACPAGQYWNGTACGSGGTNYGCADKTTVSSCSAVSGCTWDPSSNYCRSSGSGGGCGSYFTDATCRADTTCEWYQPGSGSAYCRYSTTYPDCVSKYGSGWHTMSGDSTTCYNTDMTQYRTDANGTLYSCATTPASGCSNYSGNCSTAVTQSSCNATSGCSWDSVTSYCRSSGSSACRGTTQSACVSEAGCSWSSSGGCYYGGSGGTCTGTTQTSCLSQSSCYWDTVGYPGCSSVPPGGGGGGSCPSWATAAEPSGLGSGCHAMSNAWFNTAMTRWLSFTATQGTTPNECSTNYISSCTSNTGCSGYTTSASCIAAYCTWNGTYCASGGSGGGCGSNTTQTTCNNQSGCSWSNNACSSTGGGGYCGDGNCGPTESSATCPSDCGGGGGSCQCPTGSHSMAGGGSSVPTFCMSDSNSTLCGTCGSSSTSGFTSSQCQTGSGCNNNGTCDSGETSSTCSDCGGGSTCNYNNVCDSYENTTCRDCGSGYCGDGRCSSTESSATCPSDCGSGGGGTCNYNGACDSWESSATCASDCGGGGGGSCTAPANCTTSSACTAAGFNWCSGYCQNSPCGPVCGNGTCESATGETSATCSSDCPTTPVCGNSAVESGEQCDLGGSNGTCPATCSPSCTTNTCAICGDGSCNGSESSATCPSDCGAPPPYCGDGSCNGGETAESCASDCGGGGGASRNANSFLARILGLLRNLFSVRGR